VANDINGMAVIDTGAMMGGGRAGRQAAKDQAVKGLPRAQIPGFGRPVNLKGLPQVIGLALGAPEFQRR